MPNENNKALIKLIQETYTLPLPEAMKVLVEKIAELQGKVEKLEEENASR
jgi:hypothetical protein